MPMTWPPDIPLLKTPPLRRVFSTWAGHIPFAFAVTALARPVNIVELGTYLGASYFAFCQAVRELSLSAHCWAVDTWKGDPNSGWYGEEVYEDTKAYNDATYAAFSTLVRSTFDSALDHFPSGYIDLLHIDGSHDYESVKHDFGSWLPKMCARGIVLLHDIVEKQEGFGVWRLWEELKEQYPTFEFHHSHGLGVVAVGSIPVGMEGLFAADEMQAEEIRGFFARGGRPVPTISLCMIVKDEEKNLPRCLESVRGAVDEIIVVDTGSTDNTVNIAEGYGALTLNYQWRNDFADARNLSLVTAAVSQTDWILFLDADEELPPASRDMLRPMLADMSPEVEGLLVKITSLLDEGKNSSEVLRIFRNRPEYRFQGVIHEQVMDSIMTHNQGRACIGTAYAFEILHHGYTSAAMAHKATRNLEMFETNPPAEGDLLGHYQFGQDLYCAGQYDDAIREFVAATRGIDTGQIFLPRLVRYIIMALVNGGRPERALSLVRLGTKLWPDYADLYYYGGMIEKGRGNLRVAAEFFRKSHFYEGNQPLNYSSMITAHMPLYERGLIGEAWGDVEQARRFYQLALNHKPDFQPAKDALARLDNQVPTPAALDDWALLGAYLATILEAGPVDVGTGDGQVFRGLTAEAVGRIIEGRCE